ncbi:microtubule-associated protein futsch [Diachasma alloeum]|uniref:microtubule-associated protein futsch n=1 Tax=Diachasma alloeum TaxID=454923 RepID=UPI0007384FC6|nr:microtubule-associated protein futsch [Diachasma alloeum]
MSSSGFRERGFVPQGRFEGSHAGNQGDGPRQSNTRGFSRGSFNPPRRNDRPQMDTWPPPNPQSFYQHNPHNAPQTWQSRGRFQGNLRHQFRGGSNYPARGTRGSFPRGTAPNFRSPNGRGSQNQYPNQDCRWRFPYRDFPPQNEKPEDPGPPPLGSEEERRQKITDAVDELKRKLLCNDGTSTEDMNLWDDDFNIPGPEPGDEGTLKGIPELMHGPPEIALTTSDLKDIGRVDVDSGQKSTNINENDPDCEIIDVAKSVKTFSEITIHDSEEIPLDLPENSNPDPQINAQENLPEDEGDFTNDECFLKSIELNNFNDDFNIPSNNDGITDENVSEDCPNPSDAPPDPEDVGEAPRNDEKSPEPAKPNDDLQSSNLSSMHPSPVERASPHPFELPQRREPSPDDFVDRKISNKSRSDVNRNKPRVCPVEFTPESLPNANSPTTESRESTSLHKSPRNLNFPQKITVNIKNPLDKRFTPPPLPANRAPQPAEFDILQPPPVFDPRKKNKELQIGNLMPDYNVMCPGGYSMPPMMNLPPVDYGMGPGYSSMTPFVPMNYPPVIPPLDYPTPLGPPPPLNSNLNAGLNPNLNQIPMPENPPPAANEDDAFRELRKAMEFAQELMGMGETDDINFEKECENGFDNFPTLPDLPPPLPPLPVPPAEEEIQKKSKSKKKKKKKETSQEVESPEFPSVSSVLGDSTAAPAAASAPSIPHPPSPSITPPQTISTTPPPRTITTTPPVMIKKEIMSPTKEDRPKVTFNLSLPSKKLEQSNDWREQVVSPVPVVEPDVKPAAGQAESTKRAEKLEKKMEKVVEKPENHPKKQLPTLDLMDLLRSSQFDTLNLFSSPSSSTSRPSHTPEPSETLPTPSTSSKKPQEASWKDRVIGRFLKMSKNDIKNMINNSNLRKFDIAMQHLVKEKKSSLSLEMRNTEDEKIKSKDNVYDKEDFIHQLKQILDPAATVDISDLPTNFIHQLNEVLQLDVLPQEDNTVETTLSNQETTNTPKIDELRQSESSQTLGINAPVISTGDTFKLGKIDKRVSKDTTKSLATSSDSTVNARRGKRCKNPTFTDNNQPNQLNHQFHSPDSSLSSQISVPTEAGALIMDELDDIFTAGINRARMTTKTATQNAKQTSAFTHNYGNNYATNSIISRIETPIVDRVDRIFNTGIAKAKAASKSDDQRIMRSRKGSSDLDFFRNLTKEEYDARYGESSHSSHDNPYKIMNSKNSKKFTDQINGERDQDPFLRTHTYSPRLQNNYGEHSNEDITSDEYDSASSSGSSDNSSDEPSIDVSRMLRFIKEREKMAKKKSLNEEIRDEVTAEIERKRKEKRAHKASRSKKKDRRVKRRKDKHHKNRKKKKKRNYYSGDEETSQDRSLPLLAEHQIKKEPEEEEKVDRRKQMASPQVQRKRPLVGPKSAMAKAALTHQEDPKAPTIRSPSILGAKPTHQPKLSVTNLASGASNPSPTIASPSKHSPAHSSPTSLSSSNSQNPNPFLKTKAQLKQMPEVVKKTFERPGGAEAFKKSLERKGLSTPPHQVRPMAELLGKNAGLETESFDPTVTVKVETVSPTKPASPPVSSVWGPLQSSAEGLGKSLDRVESRSPLTVSEPVESARFTFLQRNKLVEDTAISLAPFVLDNAISLRMNRPQESPQQISSGTSEAEGAKGGSRPKKLDFKAYQERALVRKLRAEGKLPPLLEKIVPDEKIQERSEINQVSGGSTSLNDPVASAAPSPPVLVKETVTKNYLPSEEAKLGDKQRDKVKTMQKSAQIPSSKEKVIDQSDVLKGKVSPPTEAKINANTGRSIPPGPLSSKRRINSGEISKREHNVSSPATEGNTSSQPQKSVEKSGIVEQEKSSQPQKSVKKSEIVEQEKSSQPQKSVKKSEILEQEKSSQPQKSVKQSEIVEQEKSSQPQKSMKKSEIVEQEKSSQPQKSVKKSEIVEQEKSSQPQKSVEKSGIVEQEKSSQPQKSVEKSGIVEQKKSSQPQKSMEKSGIVEQEKSSQPQKSVKKSELVEQEKSSQPQKSVAKSEIVEQEKSSQPQKSVEKSGIVEQKKSSQPQKSMEKSGIVEQEKSSQPQKSVKKSELVEQEKSSQPQKSVEKSGIVEQEKSSQPQKSVEKSGIVEQKKSSQPQKSMEKSGIVEQEKSSQPQKSVKKSELVEQEKSSQPQKSVAKSEIVEQEKSSQPQKSVEKSGIVEQEKSSQPQKSVEKSGIVEQEKSSQPQKSVEKSGIVEQEKSSQPQKSVEKSGIVEQEKSSQPQKSAKQSGTIEQEKSAKKGKISLKRRNKFNIHFRLCNRVSSDGLPDVVPVEGLPDPKIQNSNLQQEGISEEAGDTGAPEFVKAPDNVDSVLKMTIDGEFDEKEAELSSERLTGVVETTSTPEEAATSELSSTNPSEPLKSPFEDPLSTYDPSEKQILPVTTSNPSDIISQLDVTPELLKNEGIKSLELLEAPAQLNNELQLSTNVPKGLQDTDKVHPASSGITANPQDYTAQEETENRLEALNDSLIEAPGDSLGVHDASAPSISPLEVPPALQSLQEEALPPESLNSPREPQTSSIENLKGVDLNERNDLASLRADEATWTVDPDHLGPEDLHNLQNIPDSKEEEASFAESHTNWQLEAEISTEEARKNVVLHDRALVVDTPRNSLLDDPIAFATTNNSPTNEGEATDEFGILCENDIEGSIYENQLAETSPIDMINDSSLPLRTSFTPDDELVGGLDNDEDLDQANQVAIVVRELMEVGRKASPDRLPSLILQGMIRETEEEVKTPEQGEEGDGTVNITGEGVKIVGEGDQSTKLDGESAESHREVEDTPKVTENITKTLVEVENIQTLEEAGGTVKITEGDDKTLEEAEEDIKALQEAEEKDAKAPGGHQALDSFDASIPTADEFVRMPELEVEPQMQILAPEDVEHSLNSLVTEESPTSQSTDNQLPNSSRIDDSSAVTKTETSSGIKEGEEVIEEEKSQKTVNQQDEKSKSTQLSENLDNRVDIDSPSSSRPSPTPSEPLPTPSGPSPPPETAKPEEKDKSKDSALEKSKDRHAKKQKDVDPLKKLNKLSTSTRERKKHKHHDKKKSKITEKRVEEAIKSNIVVVSQPTTKIGVMARMREIDIAIQNLMNEKMTLYQMLQNDEWPIPQADVPEQSSVIEEKPKAKSDDPEEKSIVTKTPKVIVSRLPDVLENEQSNTSDTSSSKCVPSDVTPNDTVKPQKNSKNEEKRLPNWEDKIPHKAKKRGHSKDDTEVIKPKEARREGPADSSVSKASEDSNSKKDKKSKTLEEPVRKPVKLSQLIARDFKPKPSVPKAKSSNVSEERGRESRSKSLEKSSAKHKNVSSHVETNESSEVNARSDEKKKRKRKKLSKGAPEGQSLLYSDDSTLDSVDRAASDQKKATGLALLEESMKREAGMKKKQDSKKSKETTADDDNIDFPKSISSKKKHSQRKSNTHGKKLTTSEAPEDSKSKKHVLEVIDAVAKNRITNVQKPGVTKKQEKTEKTPEKVPEDVKKKVKEDPKKSQESKIEAKAQKKIETKLNLIDSDSSDEDVPKQEESTGPADVRTHVKTPSKRLEDSSDEKEKEKEPQEPKKPEGPSDLKTSTLKAAILDDWSDTSSSTSSKGLQKDKKTSQTSKPIVEESEDEVKGILESEKIPKSKQTDIKPSRPEKPVKSKSNAKDSDKKSTSKEADKVIPLEMEKSKKDEKEKPRIPSRVGDESPIEGDDEDEDISIRRKGTSRRSKKLSNRRSNKSSSRSRSRSKRALRSSSRDSSPEIDKVKKRPRSGSSTSSIRSRRKSFTSRTEPHLSRHKRKRQFVERSREEMMNCRVELIDCKYLLTLRPEAHPQTFRRLGISRINPWTPPKCMVLSDEKSRSEDDYQSMIVVEIDDNVGSSSAVELIEDGVDPEEDKMSDKSVCLGFPVSPRVDELAKDRREEQAELGEIEETEVLGRKGREGVSEGDVEVIDIKEEPITTPDSSTEEGCGNGGDEVVEKEVKSSEKEGELKGNNQEPGDGEGKGDDDERERMRYSAHKGPILDIKVFGDSFLAASEDGAIYRYSQKSNGILNIYKGHEAAVTCLYVHEIPGITESKKWFLFSGSLDASLRCYDVMGGILNRPKVTVGSPIQCMDEAWGSIFIGTKSGHISRYDIKTGSLREDKLDFSDKPVLALRASTEGPRKILIVASRNQPITIRDAQSGLFLRTIAGQRTHTVYSLMRDRNLVYCGTSSTSIPVFDFISGEQVTQYTAGVGIVCMRLYQQLLFAGCYDGNIYVFDTKEPKLICSIPGPGNMLLSMEIIDETIIAGSKDRQLHAWRMPPSVRTILLERT